MKILICALSGIGDALMFTPTLDKITAEFPDAKIDVLAMFGGVRNIFEQLPQINKVIHYDFLHQPKLSVLKFVLSLRGKYDISINVYPSNRKEYNGIAFLIGAKKRLAVRYKRMNTSNFGFLNNITLDEDDTRHNVEHNFLLFSQLSNTKEIAIPPLKLVINDEVQAFSEQFFIENGITDADLVIGFHPGCSTLKNHNNRRWSSSNFAALATMLIEKKGAKILLFGGPEEANLRKQILDEVEHPNAIEVIANSLTASAAVMKRCNVFVTNDSSLMHLSSALQLNVVALIGPTNICYIHPWQTNYRICSLELDCSPCFFYSPKPLQCSLVNEPYKCIRELSPEQVFAQVVDILK